MLLNYKQTGKGPDVVLIHGLFGSLENLNVIAKSLAEQYTVTNIDLRNHGKSFHSEQMDYTCMASDVQALMSHLGIPHAHLVGHSMGGKVAMQVALSFPELVTRLVVLDIAPVAYQPRHDAIFNALNNVAQAKLTQRKEADLVMQNDIEELGVRQFLLKSYTKDEDDSFTWRFNLPILQDKYQQILSEIKANDSYLCDTLFVKGNDSDYILASHREKIMQLFPKAQAKVIHGAGHWLHAQKPQAVNKVINDFLNHSTE